MNDEGAVSVIIPNWNGRVLLPACLEALRRQTHTDIEVLVVDNGSTDGSVDFVREWYPEVHLVELDRNHGFAAAANAGIAASSSGVVILLNNDTEAEPRFVEAIVNALAAHRSASFVAARMVRYDDPEVVDSAGHAFPLWIGAGVDAGAGEPAHAYLQPAWVLGACAGAAAYRRTLFDDVGAFDEDFFFFHEDMDLDLRALMANHRCLYVPGAIVRHRRGATAGKPNVDLEALIWRNRLWVAGKNFPLPVLALWALVSLPRTLWLYARHRAGRTQRSINRGVLREGLRALPTKRREIRSLRRRGSLYLLGWLLRPRRPLR